jgi:hypothetical protein
MTQNRQSIRALDTWAVTDLRVTVFATSALDLSSAISWQNLTGGEFPDICQHEPKLGALEELGKFNDGQLSLRVMPGRVDLTYYPIVESPLLKKSRLLGPYVGTVELFSKLAFSLLSMLEDRGELNFARLAFGAGIDIEVSNKEDAYNLLNDFLHDVNVDPNSSEFSYSINRIRKSELLEDININRLSKWSARYFIVSFGPGLQGRLDDCPTGIYSCHADLDINTVQQEGISLPKDKVREVFSELVGLASEIAEYGDIR